MFCKPQNDTENTYELVVVVRLFPFWTWPSAHLNMSLVYKFDRNHHRKLLEYLFLAYSTLNSKGRVLTPLMIYSNATLKILPFGEYTAAEMIKLCILQEKRCVTPSRKFVMVSEHFIDKPRTLG